MLRVTADIFSGRPNPSWVLQGSAANEILQRLGRSPSSKAGLDTGFQGLGNRGLIVELLHDNLSLDFGLPPTFRIAGGGRSDEIEIAEQLVPGLTTEAAAQPAASVAHDEPARALPLDEAFRAVILSTLPGRNGSVMSH